MSERWQARSGAPIVVFAGALLIFSGTPARGAGCEPDGTLRVVVGFTPPADKTIAGVKIDLDYPESSVRIPGFGDAPDVKARVSGFPQDFLGAPNDLDDDLVVALAGTKGLPRGSIFTVEFDHCKGAPMPAVKDFGCKVEQASTDVGVLVDGAACSVRVADGSGTKTTTNSKQSKEESR